MSNLNRSRFWVGLAMAAIAAVLLGLGAIESGPATVFGIVGLTLIAVSRK